MNSRSLLVAAVVVLGASMLLWWLAYDEAPAAPATMTRGQPVAEQMVLSSPSTSLDREPVVRAATTNAVDGHPATRAGVSSTEVEPWLAHLLVVDEHEQPVADAVVTIWAARLSSAPNAGGDPYSGHEQEPLFVIHSNAVGRAVVRLECACAVAMASKSGVGRSGEIALWNTHPDDHVTRLVVEAPVFLRGVVRHADGSPAADAKVVARVSGFSTAQRGIAPDPGAVASNADGRFSVQVQMHAGYRLFAELGEVRSLSEMLFVTSRPPPEVVLTFPGAISIAGIVVDPNGRPVVGAEVIGRRARGAKSVSMRSLLRAVTGSDGRFSIDVHEHARYELLAKGRGFANSTAQLTEPTAARPHVVVRLQLQALASIKGRVVNEHGSALAGVTVDARAEGLAPDAPVAARGLKNLFERPAGALTAADGSFELAVNPAATWTVFATPVPDNHRLRVQQEGVAAGRDDVELRVTVAALTGCVVRGRIVRADGEPLADYDVRLVSYENGRARAAADARAEKRGDRFDLGPLPLGQQFAIWVDPKDSDARFGRNTGQVAPAHVGPFTTDLAELEFEFRLERWGEVPVRVFRANGSPAGSVSVAIRPAVAFGGQPGPRRVKADGCVVMKRCVPGVSRLRVMDGLTLVHEQQLSIVPGSNGEVVVHLLAPK